MTGNMKDFATGIVVTAPSPENSGTTLTLQAGEGARMPSTPFSATAYPETEFPTLDNAERIEVTDVTGDVLTISRAQGETTAQVIEAGWRISNALFADNLEALVPYTGATTDLDMGEGNTILASGLELDYAGSIQFYETDNTGVKNGSLNMTNEVLQIETAGSYVAIDVSGVTAKTFTLPDKDGTFAMTDDITGTNSGTNTGDQTLPTRDSLGLDTDDAPQFAGVNVGHASDTTITRVSAGKIAVEGKEIIDASSPQTATNKVITNVSTSAPATPADGMLWWDTDDNATIPAWLEAVYPVGSIYTNKTNATNPGTLFGFGTWASIADSFLVGKGTGTFATAGSTGGVETVTLSAAQSGLPGHNHSLYDAAGGAVNFAAYTAKDNGNVGVSPITGYAATTSVNSALDATSSHTNLPPYTVVYMWERTA